MKMSDELQESIAAQLEQTSRLVHSLYDSGDLSVDQYDAIVHGLSGAALLRKEVVRQELQLADVMRAGDLEHARMASLIEACEALAQFVEAHTSTSLVARTLPIFYANLRVYGKNARAAVQAVRPQADALLAKMAELSRQIGEQNTTIGYQDAMLVELRKTLGAAYHGLMSYACGNSAPDLAEEMAEEIKRVLGNALERTTTPESIDRQMSGAMEKARRFNELLGPGPGREPSE